ncbi:BolA family protein [Magnetococcus sp. PR-3]|uniref:BolA family protein n=1 Tax=Magnetococcus sp. PR-3 TaxID=3120355 RepID=UPI002FCE60F8
MEVAKVKELIETGLPCDYIHVDGDGRHFEAIIVSPEFRDDAGMVQQHQRVYRVLGENMKEAIHALSLKTYTPEKWAEQNG